MSGFVIALWEQRGGDHPWLAVGACSAQCFQHASQDTKKQEKAAPLSLATNNQHFISTFWLYFRLTVN